MADWRVGDSASVDEPSPRLLESPGKTKASPRGLAGLLVGWLAPLLVAYIGFVTFWIFAIPVTLGHVAWQLPRSWRRALLAMLLSPFALVPSWSFGVGVVRYLRGNARLEGAGLPALSFYDLDPETRCYRVSSGCEIDGSEGFTQGPNNRAITLMARAFGPMAAHHQGRYLAAEEAFALVEGGRSVTVSAELFDFWSGEGEVELRRFLNRELTLSRPGRGLAARARYASVFWFHEDRGPRTLRIAERDGTIVFGSREMVWLFSRQTGALYACYH